MQVDLVGSAARINDDGKPDDRLPRRPAYGKGAIDLPVPPVTRSLLLDVMPRAARIEPGGKTQVDVAVKDFDGRAVPGAELAVVVVDEAVLALTGYASPDPLAAFYAARPPGGTDYHVREHVTLGSPDRGSLEAGVAGGVLGGVERRRARRPRWPATSSRRRRAGPRASCCDWPTSRAEPPKSAGRRLRRRRGGRQRRPHSRRSRCASSSARWRCSRPR